MRTGVVSAVTSIAALLLGGFGVAPAVATHNSDAQYWNMYDGRDARAKIDIKVTYLSVKTPGYYVVSIHGYEFTSPKLNAAEVYLDTNRSNTGPEYNLEYQFTADGDGHSGQWFGKVDTWNAGGTRLTCAHWETTVNYATDVIRMEIPRRCVGSPAEVRWNAVTWDVTEYYRDGGWYGYYDAVPGWNRFATGFWVA
jgi:hypothetical protein